MRNAWGQPAQHLEDQQERWSSSSLEDGDAEEVLAKVEEVLVEEALRKPKSTKWVRVGGELLDLAPHIHDE